MKLAPEEIIERIRKLLDGAEWDVDMLDTIADLLTENGYQVREPDEMPEDEEG